MKNKHKKNSKKFTKEDAHNIIVKQSDDLKFSIVQACHYNIEEIKEFEKTLAEAMNKGLKEVNFLIEYMNMEV